jgi:hypothetical protein
VLALFSSVYIPFFRSYRKHRGLRPLFPFKAIWIADAHRDDGKRFVVRSDDKLTGFLKLESAIWVVSAKSAQSAV